MGYINLIYEIKNQKISKESIIQEIEYGSTFALYNKKEDIISLKSKSLKWIEWNQNNEETEVKVEDSFFDIDYFFEKFLTVFVFNLLDFGDVKLKYLDITNSIFKKYIVSNGHLSKLNQNYFKGSIFKPYYHLSIEERFRQAELFISNGINVIKNDECYFRSKLEIQKESELVLKCIDNKAYYIPNITGYIGDYEFIKKLINIGVEVFMVDFIITGYSSVYRLKQKFPNIKIWGHRIGYSVLERFMSMQAVSLLALLAGIDLLHIGTPTITTIKDKEILYNELINLKPNFLPIFTKTTPEILNNLIPIFKNEAIYMSCGYFRNRTGELDKERINIWKESFNYE